MRCGYSLSISAVLAWRPGGRGRAGPAAGALWLLLAAVPPLEAQTVRSDPFAVLDEEREMHIYELVQGPYCTTPTGRESEAERRALRRTPQENEQHRLDALRAEPGLGPYLVGMAGKIRVHDGIGFGPVFEAMALREDIGPEVFQYYLRLAGECSTRDVKTLRVHEIDLLRSISVLVPRQVTPDFEELLARLLKLGAAWDDVNWLCKTAEVAARAGTARSLPALEVAQRWLQNRPKESTTPHYTGLMQSCVERLRARVARADEKPASHDLKK